ncbi:Hypothetical predicted protein, partial [Pelobates cultripes]
MSQDSPHEDNLSLQGSPPGPSTLIRPISPAVSLVTTTPGSLRSWTIPKLVAELLTVHSNDHRPSTSSPDPNVSRSGQFQDTLSSILSNLQSLKERMTKIETIIPT